VHIDAQRSGADSVVRLLRLVSGLVFAVFVILHLLNAALGLVSLEAMEAMRRVLIQVWHNPLATFLLLGSLTLHIVLSFWGLYRRNNLRLKGWEFMQLGLGVAIPLLLAGHLVGTRGVHAMFGIEITYDVVVTVLWSDPFLTVRQTLLVIVVWAHVLMGLHYWLRIKPWYARALPWLYPVVCLLPVLALLGFARSGIEADALALQAGWLEQTFSALQALTETDRAALKEQEYAIYGILAGLLLLTLAARQGRSWLRSHYGAFTVTLPSGRAIRAPVGSTVLEALRGEGVPHASVCGGRGRCTTCRMRVEYGLDDLEPADTTETLALNRIEAPPNVRLACQTRPRNPLSIAPLLPASATARSVLRLGGVEGREQQVAILFLDLRGSTALGERLLPYDVVYVLNRFFAGMSQALHTTGGHYAQFNGDGLMALYGLDSDLNLGSRCAIHGAMEMLRKLDALNRELHLELGQPLSMGIGIHSGEAIVGRMGPPDAPIVSALGDNVNIAARLESLTKTLDCPLVVSEITAKRAAVDLSAYELHTSAVRGRAQPIQVYAVTDPTTLDGQWSFADRLV
jgi:adenylate cyclase